MEPEVSWPCTIQSVICPYPEADESNLRPPVLFIKHQFSNCNPIYAYMFKLFFSPCCNSPSLFQVLYSLASSWSYTVFSTTVFFLLILLPSYFQTFCTTPCFPTLQCGPTYCPQTKFCTHTKKKQKKYTFVWLKQISLHTSNENFVIFPLLSANLCPNHPVLQKPINLFHPLIFPHCYIFTFLCLCITIGH
jgi:hypothetical protein